MRGQVAVEFLVLMGFMLLVFTTFFLVVQQRTVVANERVYQQELAAVARTIEQEVLLAQRVRPGYERIFELPVLVHGQEYSVDLQPAQRPSEIVIKAPDREYVLFLQVNLSSVSDIRPGYNRVRKSTDDNITINAVPKPTLQCNAPSDCNDGNQCTTDTCTLGLCSYPPNANPCDDGNPCTLSDVCSGGSCAGTPKTCPGSQTCNPLTGNCENMNACPAGQTNIRYFAGSTTVPNGINWNPAGALSRDYTMDLPVCCNNATQCVNAPGVCVGRGVYTDPTYVCENTGLGAEFFTCAAARDGMTFTGAIGSYCCSIFSAGARKGTFGFNATADANKAESLAIAGSCADTSDNDCDGLKDAFAYGCWNALLNASCTSGTSVPRYENLTAYPNMTMPGTTRYAYDWKLGGTSIDVLNLNFDVPNNPVSLQTRDYSAAGRNGTIGGNAIPNPGFETGSGADASSWTESVSADRTADKRHYGGFSMKHVAPTAPQASVSTAFTPQASRTYVLHGWIYNNLTGASNAYLDLGDVAWECTALSTQRNTWQYVSCQFTTPATPPSVRVRLVTDGATIGSNTGHAWFDDVGVSILGPQWSASGRGGSGAYSFDGADDYINIGLGALNAITNTFTMELWVNPTATRASTVEANSGVSGTNGQRYAIYPSHGGVSNGGAGVSVGTNGVSVFEHGGSYLPSLLVHDTAVSGWTHVVVVYSNKQPSLYLNGIFVKTGLQSARTAVFPGANLGESGGSARYGPYQGLIDEVRIYNRALTAAQIKALYQGRLDRMVDAELLASQQWSVCITPNNGTADGPTTCTNTVTTTSSASGCSCPANTCTISNTCYANGAANPSNSCQYCNTAVSTTSWTNRANGYACDDGYSCTTGETCSAGVCQTGTISSGKCLISGTCYNRWDPRPGNVCYACIDTTSKTSWSVYNYNSCDDGQYCTAGDYCLSGTCRSGTSSTCSSPEPVCLEDEDRCVECTWDDMSGCQAFGYCRWQTGVPSYYIWEWYTPTGCDASNSCTYSMNPTTCAPGQNCNDATGCF